jgi:hypothetical protein
MKIRAPSHHTSPDLGISYSERMKVLNVYSNPSLVELLACYNYIRVAHSLPVAQCILRDFSTNFSASISDPDLNSSITASKNTFHSDETSLLALFIIYLALCMLPSISKYLAYSNRANDTCF